MASKERRRYVVQIYNKIQPEALALFDPARFEVVQAPKLADEPDAILVRSQKLGAAELKPTVKIVARAGSGVNTIDVELATKQATIVANTPDANANAVKELVLLCMLMAARRIPEALRWVDGNLRGADHAVYTELVEANKAQFMGEELTGSTLGVAGLGAIGRRVAQAALDLGMTVRGYDPVLADEDWNKLPKGVAPYTDLNKMVAECHFVTAHVPLVPSTRGLMGAEAIAAMKQGAVLINAARDKVVDREAVRQALAAGHLGRYCTDFPLPDVLNDPAVADKMIALPHLGANTRAAQLRASMTAARHIIGWLTRGDIANSVNVPGKPMDAAEGARSRVSVLHANVPDMSSTMAHVFGAAGLNRLGGALHARPGGELGFEIFDLEQAPSPEVLRSLESLKGVKRVMEVTF